MMESAVSFIIILYFLLGHVSANIHQHQRGLETRETQQMIDGGYGSELLFSGRKGLNDSHQTSTLQSSNVSVHGDGGSHSLRHYVGNQACLQSNVWMVSQNGTCHCGNDLDGIVNCDADTTELSVIDCYCLTVEYTEAGAVFPVVGGCIFNCVNVTDNDIIFHGVPSNCGSLKRQGTLCGQCLDGYAIPAYSYRLECIRCDSALENWGLYVTYAFLPLTFFIGITLVLRINVFAPKLYTFVFAAQIVTSPALVKIILYYIDIHKSYHIL